MLEQSSNNDANPNCYSSKAPAPEKKQKIQTTTSCWSAFRKKIIINIKQPKILQQQSAEVLFTEEHQP